MRVSPPLPPFPTGPHFLPIHKKKGKPPSFFPFPSFLFPFCSPFFFWCKRNIVSFPPLVFLAPPFSPRFAGLLSFLPLSQFPSCVGNGRGEEGHSSPFFPPLLLVLPFPPFYPRRKKKDPFPLYFLLPFSLPASFAKKETYLPPPPPPLFSPPFPGPPPPFSFLQNAN